jgi:hypothetical protein
MGTNTVTLVEEHSYNARNAIVNTLCQICEKRRARRHCPGVGGEICPQCCGEQRENTIDCPSDCEHLREARHREVPPPITEADVPNRDVPLTEQFVREHEPLIFAFAMALRRAMEEQRAVDFDAREALAALIRTYRTLESGLIYETQPTNPYAAAILDRLKASIENLRKGMEQEAGMPPLRDADTLGVLVFLQRLELQHNNGRRKGRAFLDFLRAYLPEPEPQPAASQPSLIL